MHRHGYQGRKFGRETDQRRALVKSLAEALILRESIETTLPKAKEVRSYVEKLVTKAKKGDLHNQRQVIASLQTQTAATKLVSDIAPKLSGRTSGYLRVKRSHLRRGDGAQLAVVSFVDDLAAKAKPASKAPAKKTAAPKTSVKKPAQKVKA